MPGNPKPFTFSRPDPGGGNFTKRANGLLFVVVESDMVNTGKSVGAPEVSLRNKSGDLSGQRGGTFSQFQADFLRRNQILARELAELAVEKLRASYARPDASSGALERALLDPRNIVIGQGGTYWGVGNEKFLDRSAAKYWRTIERGTRHFVGKPMVGVWEHPGSGRVYPFSRHRTKDIFRPFASAADAMEFLRANGERGPRGGVGKTWGIIKRPIRPHNYLRDAWKEFRPRERSKEALRAALRESGVIRS